MEIRSRRLAALVLPLLTLGVLAGCASTPGQTEPTPSAPATPAPEPTETEEPAPAPTSTPEGFVVPEQCEDVWTPEMLADLTATTVLNDPGVTMLSTEVVEALEVLDVAPNLRCTWGQPSDWGIATTVAEVDAEQSELLVDALLTEGFACTESEPQRCERTQTFPPEAEGGPETAIGETHLIGDGGWVATHWLNADVEPEYSDAIVAQLWG